jgi:hypothetical protein
VRLRPRLADLALVWAWALLVVGNERSVGILWIPSILLVTLAVALLVGVVAVTNLDGLAPPPRLLVTVAAITVSLLTLGHPVYSYAAPDDLRRLTHFVCLYAVVAAVLWLLSSGRVQRGGVALAAIGALVAVVAVIALVPEPRIDVWYFLSQAVDVTLHAHDMYGHGWVNSPGIAQGYTYLPMTDVAVTGGKELGGDVRWAMVAALVLSGVLMTLAARRQASKGAVLLYAVTPGLIALVEQSWTEPLLLLWLVAALFCVDRGHLGWAVVFLAVACATKQHALLLLPVFAMWRPFGLRRTAAAAAGAVVLCMPWLIADLSAFWHDTVSYFLHLPPRADAPTLFTAAVEAGWTPPRVIVGIVVLGGIGLAAWKAHGPVGTGAMALCCAVALGVADLVNQQTFYNQWWLVGSLVLVGLAWSPASSGSGQHSRLTERAGGR